MNASWQTAAVYPDSTDVLSQDTNGVWSITTDNADHTSSAYDLMGRTTSTTDQRGVVHEYSFDTAGRLAADTVTSLGASGIVDGTVRRIGTAYDDVGRVQSVTSYGDTSGTTVLNQVFEQYDGWGNLTEEWQSHDGPVDTDTTPSVQYTYDDGAAAGVAKYGRLTDVTYPNGRDVSYGYGTAGAVDDIMSRLATIGDSGGTLAAYKYLGAGTIAVEDYVASQTKLTYLDSGGDVVWLDRFGRVADKVWEHYYLDGSGNEIADGTPDSFAYGYDAAGNPLWKENTLAHNLATPVNLDELYANDDLYRLLAVDRGRLNSAHTALESGSATLNQDWTLDGLGNFSGFDDNGTSQTRQTNAANEITGITRGATTTNPAYDAAGNLGNDGTLEYTYDAWNRQVAVRRASDDSLVATYAFDGLNRRTAKTLSAGPATDYYYNEQWQVLEERQPVTAQANPMVTQYVWDESYIDSPIVRLRDAAGSGTYTSLYYTTDANHNVTALVDPATGDVVERYVYEPYGKVTVCDASWNVRADGPDENSTPGDESAYGNETLFCGYRYDPETALADASFGTSGNYQVRYREYATSLGDFDTRDPVGYTAGDPNLYRHVGNRPASDSDAFGLWKQSDKKNKNLWTAEGDEDSLMGLSWIVTAAQGTPTNDDWVCIWPQTKGYNLTARKPNRLLWDSYPYAHACAVADVSNLNATSGPNIAMRAQFDLDTDLAKRKKLAQVILGNANSAAAVAAANKQDYYFLSLTLSPQFANAWIWKDGRTAAEYIGRTASWGARPIQTLMVGGHSDGDSIGSFTGGTDFNASHVMAYAATLGLGDNTRNTVENASNGHGPPKCWFTHTCAVTGWGCMTGQPGKWAETWATTIARKGSTVYGAKDWIWGTVTGLTAKRYVNPATHTYQYIFLGASTFYHGDPNGVRSADQTWAAHKGNQ